VNVNFSKICDELFFVHVRMKKTDVEYL
jgi:hypothetical protein